eukprot:TRINITY_DN19513_c0_g1_i4.p1 TRINITY_DN19513_c0_g1~~TRINITY_DN19513_c0_g1_i4.p1  ORF type:complete len:241 (+),score=42.08 TRINITY_DN19513_c0_g1_i4:133-855(+)
MIRRPPRSTQGVSSAASDVYKRQGINAEYMGDPFWDENEPIFIGMGFYMLKGLSYMLDNPVEITLIGNLNEHTGGKLNVNVIPTTPEGSRDLPSDMIPEDPAELVGGRLDFQVEIREARDLPENCCKDVFCEYSFHLDETKYTTSPVKGRSRNVNFSYCGSHTVDVITENFLNYLLRDYMCIKVYGYSNSIKVGRPTVLKRAEQAVAAKQAQAVHPRGVPVSKKPQRQGCDIFQTHLRQP